MNEWPYSTAGMKTDQLNTTLPEMTKVTIWYLKLQKERRGCGREQTEKWAIKGRVKGDY